MRIWVGHALDMDHMIWTPDTHGTCWTFEPSGYFQLAMQPYDPEDTFLIDIEPLPMLLILSGFALRPV